MAALSNAWVCGCSTAGIAGSSNARGVLRGLCVVR